MDRTWFNILKRRKSSPHFHLYIWTAFSTFSVCEPLNILKEVPNVLLEVFESISQHWSLPSAVSSFNLNFSSFVIIRLSESDTDIHEPTLPAHHHHNLPFYVLHHFIEEVPKQIHLINPTCFHCKEQSGDWQLPLKYW